MKIVLIAAAAILGVFIVFAIIGSNDPAIQEMQRDRRPIAACWDDHAKKSNTESRRLLVAAACERMEAEFVQKHGRKP